MPTPPAPQGAPRDGQGAAAEEARERALAAAAESPEADAERARRARRFSAYAQAGGITFLAVVSLGLLPSLLSVVYPAAGERAAVLVWVLAPAIPIALLVVAALKLPR